MGKHDRTVTLSDATLPIPDGVERSAGPAPASIGRFTVLGHLGEGGMGSVLEAYDEALERRVAIKVLHQVPLPGNERRHSLRREAQVLARLSHPNVVQVYEVGEHEDQVYIAMELVRGGTLDSWLRARPRSFDEIRAVMCAAGRGLQAAHDRGLVHRDFKPDNVLVGDDGRPRVVDFGLARATHGELPSTLTHDDPSEEHAPAVRTRAAGTVPYMAPEQLLGLPVDARTDQFAFCVALYELVYGRHPFTADDAVELSMRIVEGQADPIPPRSRVPAALEPIIRRGMERRPEHRYPDMATLLEALEAVGQPRRHPSSLLVGVALGLMSLGVLSTMASPDPPQRCGDGRQEVEQVWDEARRDRLHHAIIDSGVEHAAATWVRLRDHLDTYAAEWIWAHQSACRAPSLASPQAEALLERRMECLGDRLRQMRGLVEVLSTPDATAVEHAVTAAAALPSAQGCSDPSALPLRDDAARSPQAQALIARTREQLADVRARLDTGDHEGARERLGPIDERVQSLDAPTLRAEVLLLQGELAAERGELARAERLLADAFWIAEGRGLEPLAVDAGIRLVEVVGDELQRFEDGLTWVRHTRAVLERAGLGGVRQGWLLNNRGNILFEQGRFDAAADAYRSAIAIAEHHDARLPQATFANNLGNVHLSLGRLPQAERQYLLSLTLRERELGPDHPELVSPLVNLGATYVSDDEPELARPLLERARALADRRDPVQLASVLTSLGLVCAELGEPAQARAHLTRAGELLEQALGPEHPDLAHVHHTLADLDADAGQWDRAERGYRRALAILEPVAGSEPPNVATIHEGLGTVLRDQGELTEARASFVEAIRIREAVLGRDDRSLLLPLVALGELELDARRHRDALEHLERARELAKRHPPSPTLKARLDDALDRSSRG